MRHRSSRLQFGRISVVVAVCLLVALAFARTSQAQQAGDVQTEPIDEPRSAEHKPTGPPIPKGMQAITQTEGKCSTELIINAEALFKPTRWTLNPDAPQTLNALALLVTKAGKHPVRITAYSGSDNSENNNQIVAEKRALNVRTWLANHDLVPKDATIEGIGRFDSSVQETKEPIEIVIDTCKQLPSLETR